MIRSMTAYARREIKGEWRIIRTSGGYSYPDKASIDVPVYKRRGGRIIAIDALDRKSVV